MLCIIRSAFEAPDIGAEGGFALGGVLLCEESGIVVCVGGTRSLDACVDSCGDGGELGSYLGLFGGYRRGAGDGTESTEVDAGAIRAGGWCLTMRGENHLLVLGVRRFFVDLVQRAGDGFKHRGIRCFCHDFWGYGLRVMGYGTFFRVAFPLRLFAVLLYVVETQSDDF